jgi:hypothetical protein
MSEKHVSNIKYAKTFIGDDFLLEYIFRAKKWRARKKVHVLYVFGIICILNQLHRRISVQCTMKIRQEESQKNTYLSPSFFLSLSIPHCSISVNSQLDPNVA